MIGKLIHRDTINKLPRLHAHAPKPHLSLNKSLTFFSDDDTSSDEEEKNEGAGSNVRGYC